MNDTLLFFLTFFFFLVFFKAYGLAQANQVAQCDPKETTNQGL